MSMRGEGRVEELFCLWPFRKSDNARARHYYNIVTCFRFHRKVFMKKVYITLNTAGPHIPTKNYAFVLLLSNAIYINYLINSGSMAHTINTLRHYRLTFIFIIKNNFLTILETKRLIMTYLQCKYAYEISTETKYNNLL